MKKIVGKKWIAGIMAFSLLGATLPSVSYAEIIGTQTLLEASQLADSRARVEAFVSQQSVRDQMVALGADPAEVQGRIAALTEGELRTLENSLSTMPAGGSLLGVVGLVFVVLMILEFTGVIDIFKKA